MKLTKIIAAVKGRYIVTSRMDGVTWVSDGYAAYPLYGMPRMTRDMALTLMGIPEKDRDAVSFVEETDGIPLINEASFDDAVMDERELLPVNLQVVVAGITLIPMMCDGTLSRGADDRTRDKNQMESKKGINLTANKLSAIGNVVFVDQKYLKPFASDKRDYRPYLRFDKNGAAYVAIKDGYFLKGVVYPSPAIDVAEKLAEMAKCILPPTDADEPRGQERMACDGEEI